jgi:molybdopterin adenylyltransferase
LSILNVAVLTISDSRTIDDDKSGRYLVAQVAAIGHRIHDRQIVRDDIYAIRAIVSAWIADPAVQIILTTGGTGVTGRDGTPEAIAPLLDKTIEGFGELFRHLSYAEIKTASIQSRAIAGVANGTYIFTIPGSSGACKTAWEGILRDQLDEDYRPCNFVGLLPRLSET